MPSKEIEIDLDDFDVDDIIDHLEYQVLTSDEVKSLLRIVIKNKYKVKGMKLSELELEDEEDYNPGWPEINNLSDKYKQEAVCRAWDLPQAEFETRLAM